MQPDLLPDLLQGHTLLHHVGMHHERWGAFQSSWSQCVGEDYSHGATAQIIQQLTYNGADINAQDIRVCAMCNLKPSVAGRHC